MTNMIHIDTRFNRAIRYIIRMKVMTKPTLILAMLLTLAVCMNSHAENLPDIGDAAGRILTPTDEHQIGAQFYRRLQQSVTLVDDPEINQYLRALGLSLVSNSDNPFQPYLFFVVDDPTVNAFAAPGGYIGIHSGLIFAARNEGELASVLAHEIAHITQRHIARAIEAQTKSTPLNTAALLAAILLGASGNGQAATAAVATVVAGSAQSSINFTRANEKEADRAGITILARSNINPGAMADFFGRLEQISRVNKSSLPEFLRTHPVTQSRIADSRARADQYTNQHKELGRKDSEYFQLIKARLRVLLADDKKNILRQFESEANKKNASTSTQYGYALALTQRGQYSKARKILNTLLAQSPDDNHYVSALAKVELGDNNNTGAIKLLAGSLELNPHNHAVTLNYAKALLLANKAQDARKLLQTHLRRSQPQRASGVQFALTYKLLAQALGKTGATIEAHEALAEYYLLSGNNSGAIEQLEIAVKLAERQDNLAAQRIEARLEQLQPKQDEKG
ncbi:MAG: M48 family metallopeptidase [Gammaproteobacteria bacterium]|nr:M48 family metallopeptidase [Gammaproteobacteria bacterium]